MDASTWCVVRCGLTWLLLTLTWSCGVASGGNETTVPVTEAGTTVVEDTFGAGLTTLDDTFLYLRDANSEDLKDNVIQVGGLFETKEDAILFQAAVDVVNEDSSINMEPDLLPLVELLPEDDSYEAVRDTCRLLLRGVGAVFGPMSSMSGEHVSDVCNSLNVPHVETRWDPAQEAYDDSLNLFPDPAVLAEAYVALMSHWQWRSVAIVYEEDEEVAEMKGLLEELREADIDADHYARNSTDSFRDVLKRVREDGHTHIFVAIEEEDTEPFLMQALQIEMLNDDYSYLFRSLDFHMADLSDFIYCKANITALRIVDVDDPAATVLDKKIEALEAENTPKPTVAATGEEEEEEDYEGDDDDHVKFPLKLSTDAAMLYDAVKLFALSLIEWNGGKDAVFPALDCREDTVSDDNNTDELIAVMKKVQFDGLTGMVKLDNKGVRTDVKLYVTELGLDGLEEIGTWSPTTGLNITEDEADDDEDEDEVLRVLSVAVSPFMMVNVIDGKNVYSGFCVDLLDKLSAEMDFKYELHVVADSKRGSPNASGHWDGMIGEVIAGRADLALADLTITEHRERVIDFTLPYMTAGLVAVSKKGEPRNPGGIWSFFLPLTREVWIYILLATACTVFVMYISARLSFREWMLVDDGKGGECMENRFNLFNCFLFVLTTLLHQRVSLDPRAPATRVLAGFWYFFTFIVLAIVVSNLCESILWQDSGPDYDSVDELMKTPGFTYLAIRGGSTRSFLEHSSVPLHQRLSQFVERSGRNNPGTFAEGLDRVKNEEKVAFIMEYAAAAYITQSDCEFTMTDTFVHHSAYGIATARGSEYRSLLSEGILKLQEDGRLQWLQERWWKPNQYCGQGDDLDGDGDGDSDEDDEEAHSLEARVQIRQLTGADLAGAFVIVYVGFIIAAIFAVGELFYVFSTRAKRETHLNSIAVSDHMKQAGYVWRKSMDLTEMTM
ncbi:glutamate receptor ionotropic, kainate 2 [Dermacentor silvarum]|uniref:glutamate receptor ionotropic, kainate 2 n=1 Tax=Dermacentor silvarum TaxID=543639 RepID=UPI0018976FDC|nr:glutamate receptor ionotropic, kainate 2 [Dermacentor silvarum]